MVGVDGYITDEELEIHKGYIASPPDGQKAGEAWGQDGANKIKNKYTGTEVQVISELDFVPVNLFGKRNDLLTKESLEKTASNATSDVLDTIAKKLHIDKALKWYGWISLLMLILLGIQIYFNLKD